MPRDCRARIVATLGPASSDAAMIAAPLARVRPAAPIVALTPNITVARQLALLWGTHPILTDAAEGVAGIVGMACSAVAARGVAGAGDIIAIAAGMPCGVAGTTNLLRIEHLPTQAV